MRTENSLMTRPKSAVSGWTGVIGAFSLCAGIVLTRISPMTLSASQEIFFLLMLCSGSMALYEILIQRAHRQSDTGLEWTRTTKTILKALMSRDMGIKILGMGMSLLLFAFFWSMPIYTGKYYQPFFQFLNQYSALIITVSTGYFLFIHTVMKDARDGFWHLGACLMPRLWPRIDKSRIQEHALALCVKIFFLPLMFVFFTTQWETLRTITQFPQTLQAFFDVSIRLLFLFDIAFSIIGYVFTLRLFNAHVRRTEKQWGGWIVCLICYAPFNQVVFNNFLSYQNEIEWQAWLGDMPALYIIWGSLLLISYGIYVSATINFGLRFSNLTYRGIITHGVYAYSKHPAYISKNFTWWLEQVPFIASSFIGGLKHCIILAIINYVYYKRAQYEERMLTEADDTYHQYAAYIQQHGIIARISRFIGQKIRQKFSQ